MWYYLTNTHCNTHCNTQNTDINLVGIIQLIMFTDYVILLTIVLLNNILLSILSIGIITLISFNYLHYIY